MSEGSRVQGRGGFKGISSMEKDIEEIKREKGYPKLPLQPRDGRVTVFELMKEGLEGGGRERGTIRGGKERGRKEGSKSEGRRGT